MARPVDQTMAEPRKTAMKACPLRNSRNLSVSAWTVLAFALCCCLEWALPLPVFAGAPVGGAWTEDSIEVGGEQRWYRIYRPKGLPPLPAAVVLLHGGGQSMRKIFRPYAGGTRAWVEVAERHSFLLIVPNGVNPETGDAKGDNQQWNDLRPATVRRKSPADDVSFIAALLDWAGAEYGIDPRRVYVTGASNGGMMAHRLLIETPERFAAAAGFVTALPADVPLARPPLPTPLLILNGTEDPLVLWQGGMIPGRRGRTKSVEDTLGWWVEANRADPARKVEKPLPDLDADDGCRIFSTFYPAAEGGAPVLFLKVEGGGHCMPSRNHHLADNFIVRRWIGPECRDAEGAELAWDFMSQFQRERP